jgi:hypothetical protein
VVRHVINLPRDRAAGEGSLNVILRNESFLEREGYMVDTEDMKDEKDFPSWVPRWDQCRMVWMALGWSELGQTWNSSGDSTITVRETEDAAILSLRGFEVTTIAFLEREFELPNPPLMADNSDNTIFQ